MKHLKSIILAALAVVVAGAYALPAPSVAAQSSASLSIAPKKNYVIEPGKSVDDKLTIRNLDNTSDLELTLRVVDFTFTGDGGTPKLFLDENAEQTTWSLRPFLKVPKTVTVPKSGSKTVDISVAIPKVQGAGSYYSAIIYSTGAPDGGNVGLAASGVTLAFVNVPGKVHEDLKLEKFGAYRPAVSGKQAGYVFFATDEPQHIGYTLKNNGNVAEAPVGSITLTDLFGRETVINEVNPNGSLALIGQSRTYTACIKLKEQSVDFNGSKTDAKTCVSPGLWPGYYSAKLNLFYGQNGNITQEIVGNASFIYLPWWFIIVLIIVIAVITFIVWKIVRKVRGRANSHRFKKSTRKK